MSDESKNGVNYKLKVSPEGMDTFTKLDEGVTKVNEGIKGMSEHLSSIGQVLSLTALKESMAGIQETLESIMKPSESFDAALKDFGTGANISGDALEEFGGFAADAARPHKHGRSAT